MTAGLVEFDTYHEYPFEQYHVSEAEMIFFVHHWQKRPDAERTYRLNPFSLLTSCVAIGIA